MAEVDKEDKLPGLVVAIAAPAPAGDDNDRDSFEYECKEAHRSRREFMQGGGIGIISHEHYHASDAASRYNRSCLDLYRVDDITSITDGRVLLEEGGTGPIRSTHTYAYRLQSEHGLTPPHSPDCPSTLVFVSMEPPMTELDNFSRWYEEEHIPLLQKVQGYLSCYRGSLMWSSKKAEENASQPLKYAAFHRYASPNGLNGSPEYTKATSGPWRQQIVDAVGDRKDRHVWAFQQTHLA